MTDRGAGVRGVPVLARRSMAAFMVESCVTSAPYAIGAAGTGRVVGEAGPDCCQVVEVGGRPSPATPTDERGVGITRGCYD